MLYQLAQSIAKLWDLMISLTCTYMWIRNVVSYYEIFSMVPIACALKFDDFHSWVSGHLWACYLLCLVETFEYKHVKFMGRN